MSRLIEEVAELSRASVEFAQGIGHATAGDRLTKVMSKAMDGDMRPYNRLRDAVKGRLDQLGGVGEEFGLFMLAADMATTAEVGTGMDDADRRALRTLWDDLRARD